MDDFSGLGEYPVLLLPPSYDARLPYGCDPAAVVQHSSSSGLWLPLSATARARRQWEMVWRVNRSGRATLRAFYDAVQGKHGAFWLPSWLREFRLLNPIPADSYYIEVADSSFREADDGTVRLYLQTHNGDRYTRLVAASESYLGGERLRVDSAFAEDVEKEAVAVCCRLVRVRFASSLSGGPVPGVRDLYEYRVQVVEDVVGVAGTTCEEGYPVMAWGLDTGEYELGILGSVPMSTVSPCRNGCPPASRVWATVGGGMAETADSFLFTWGYDYLGLPLKKQPPALFSMRKPLCLSGGLSGNFIIYPDGELWAAGHEGKSGLGYTSRIFRKVVDIPAMCDVSSLSNSQMTPAVDVYGNIWMWGYGSPFGSTWNLPNMLQSGSFLRARSWSTSIILAVDTSGALFGWGTGSKSLLFQDDITFESFEKIHDGPFVDVLLMEYSAVGLTPNGQVFTWGENSAGALGIGAESTFVANSPQPVSLPAACTAIRCGGNHVLCLLADGRCYGFGPNCFGSLGIGNKLDQFLPVELPGLWVDVSAIGSRSFGLAK